MKFWWENGKGKYFIKSLEIWLEIKICCTFFFGWWKTINQWKKKETKQSFKPNRRGCWSHCPIKFIWLSECLLVQCSLSLNSTTPKKMSSKIMIIFIFWRKINNKSIILDALFNDKPKKKNMCTHSFTYSLYCSPNTDGNVFRVRKRKKNSHTLVKYCFHIIIGVVQWTYWLTLI